jgi:hypothetical protein
MLGLLICAQLAVADSAYSSPGLRAFIEAASILNRTVPASLYSYRASVESEIALVARRADGVEGTVSIEQVQNDFRWRRTGEVEQRVIGHRVQSLGLQFSSLSWLRQAWLVPVLYGNRMSLLLGTDTTRTRMRRPSRQRMTAVHPLAEDRDRVYRFSGGDTVVTMRIGSREIPVVKVLVEPRADAPPRTVAFRGELDLDATRHQVVRMRGYFVSIAPVRTLAERVVSLGGLEALAFVELENAEFDGQYWLPSAQRFEAQVGWTSASDSRSIFRILSRFRQHKLNDTTVLAAADTMIPQPHRLSWAPRDSIDEYEAWPSDLGDLTAHVHSDDFADLVPDYWSATGAARISLRVRRLPDAFHYNRIEGAYTGWGIEARMRDRAPGVTLRANAGWAWSEETVRGRASAEWMRGDWTFGVRGGRSLDLTNDFRSPFDSGTTIGALLGSDNYDYVDRRSAAIVVERRIGKERWARVKYDAGPARDGMVRRHVLRPPFGGDSAFRPNRGVQEGTYWRQSLDVEWRPDVSAELMRTGVGAALHVEHATGDLDFVRLESRFMARRNARMLTLAVRTDVGAVWGSSPPPQQLFEIGREQALHGYEYKQFAGDRAVLVRATAMHSLPVLRSPMRFGRLVAPGLSPALAVSLQSAWTALNGVGAAETARGLSTLAGVSSDSVLTGPTGGIRSSMTLGMRFFGGSLGVGVARPVDRAGRWRLRVDLSQML